MALQSSGAISMGDMRTEFGISGAISMSDLYRGGSEVPSSVNTTVTVSEVANILTGYGMQVQDIIMVTLLRPQVQIQVLIMVIGVVG